jgi:hypothetical protein
VILAALFLLCAGCVADTIQTPLGEPSTASPWRLAIMPTQLRVDENGESPSLSADVLREARTCVAMQMPDGPYEVVPLPVVDRAYPPENAPPSHPEEFVEIASATNAQLILVPEIFSWDRNYYLIHAVARVGIGAKLYDGLTGELLYESQHEQVMNQGNFKIPGGYLAVVAGPIVGLQGIYLSYMCNNVAGKIGTDIETFLKASGQDTSSEIARPESPLDSTQL